MNHASLASKYRPQTFAEVTGQETVKAILSRAAAENRVAPAYLLSGTRGVGKTTIARIFAKALNCEHAPAAEPCNQCRACRSITQGNFVDVVEIDGASNRGIDDARRLRESIGYAPMEGRYKVFIIDEAHMLTKESFNALLKTLEEPPPQVTFIMATTEPQKFPVTIISRCQHFVFSALPENELVSHLQNILKKEGVDYEENAVRLIARRAAGSVRDSMSLLGQTLALGDEKLSEASAREVLGLVGQELYGQILSAIQAQDCVRVSELTRELLRTGADLGFFLRELALMWRNLFLLRQAGKAALPLIDLSENEKESLAGLAQKFELSAIHAAWQMTLEGQRQVLTCLEPASALELLLLNLAMLPRLASIARLSQSLPRTASSGTAAFTQSPGTAASQEPRARENNETRNAGSTAAFTQLREQRLSQDHGSTTENKSANGARQATSPAVTRTPAENSIPPASSPKPAPVLQESRASAPSGIPATAPGQPMPAAAPGTPSRAAEAPQKPEMRENNKSANGAGNAAFTQSREQRLSQDHGSTTENKSANGAAWPCPWEEFLDFCLSAGNASLGQLIRQTRGLCEENSLTLQAGTRTLFEMLSAPERQDAIRALAEQRAGHPVKVMVSAPEKLPITEGALKKNMADHPAVRLMEDAFNARLVRSSPLHKTPKKP